MRKVSDWFERQWARLSRLKYRVLSFKNHGERLNRSVEVEIALYNYGKGKRELTREQALELSMKLGVPKCYWKYTSLNK